MKVAVIGTGYVGLVTGVIFAELGNDVICVDNDEIKLEKLRRGISPIYEPGIEELLRRAIHEGFLNFSKSVGDATRESEIVFIAVGTPPLQDGTPDLSAVQSVAHDIAKAIDKPTVVVNKSTVPVGSGDMVERIILSHGVSSELFDVVSNPEFLREGSAIQDSLHPDRIVIGAKRKEAAHKLVELYAPMERPMFITDLNSAELIKYASNTFLAMKISFINGISRLCELCGADVGDVAKGVGADSRIGPQFLNSGLGWGGSCFPKDVHGLLKTAERYGYDFGLVREVIAINDDQTPHFIDRIEERLKNLKRKVIGVLGLAFKPNTDDIRESRALMMIDRLLESGAEVRAFDPVAAEKVAELYPQVIFTRTSYDVAKGADAVILATEWNEFKTLDLERLAGVMRRPILFDGRRIYKREYVERCGLEYHTVGVSSLSNEELSAALVEAVNDVGFLTEEHPKRPAVRLR